MLEPLGNIVTVREYIDASHSVNVVNRRSNSGLVIYANQYPVLLYSKIQNTVESSSFGSEFVALRIET